MLNKLFRRNKPEQKARTSQPPEILGLRLGGAFELSDLWLRLIEPDLVIEGAARTQLIQAVGVVKLDENSTILRYYTDDDAYLRVYLDGGMTENHIGDVKLWYFYDTTGVNSQGAWDELIQSGISSPSHMLEGHEYSRVWNGEGGESPPVAWTEKTYSENGEASETDQFTMMYEREIPNGRYEYLMKTGEEKFVKGQPDRCCVISTGFDVNISEDIYIIG